MHRPRTFFAAVSITMLWFTGLSAASPNTDASSEIPFQSLALDLDCDGRTDKVSIVRKQGKVNLVIKLSRHKQTKSEPMRSERFDLARLRLQPEPMDITDEQFQQMLGERPEGYIRSRTCSGFALIDEQQDSLHFYWNHQRKELSVWSL